MKIQFELTSQPSDSFRCTVAAQSLDIDVKKKLTHKMNLDINMPEKWNIGVVYGASGSGKTTLAKHLFKDKFEFVSLNEEKTILDQFSEDLEYNEIVNLLNGIGLSQVPCWLRPVKTLSNGQKARAEIAYLLTQNKDFFVVDEWTSVVDRVVAKVMSNSVQKYIRKHNKQMIFLSCHNDILSWLAPDWVIDCNTQQFKKTDKSFFFGEREQFRFDIKEVGRKSWQNFSKYHYLSENLPGGKIYCYGLFLKDKQIGFICFAGYVPGKPIYHFNRVVIHPDYVGLGLGIRLINETCKELCNQYKIMGKFSSEPIYRAMKKFPNIWRFLGTKRLNKKMVLTGSMSRTTSFREKGVKTYHFEYIKQYD